MGIGRCVLGYGRNGAVLEPLTSCRRQRGDSRVVRLPGLQIRIKMNESSSDSNSEILSASHPSRRAQRIWVTACALTFAALASFLFTRYSTYQKVQETVYGQALLPAKDVFNFSSCRPGWETMQATQLRGKLVLFSFGFTNCPNVCPTTLSALAKVYRSSAETRIEARPEYNLSVSRSDFDSSFVGLTGTDERLAETANKETGVRVSTKRPDQQFKCRTAKESYAN
jgi:cytochrome oxidase Cu insertion factor (SCO1/SenC/PrrC family)